MHTPEYWHASPSNTCGHLTLIDLATWNLSVPVGSPPATIDTPKLVSGFKNQYFHANTGTLFFWAPVTGTRTENAIYPRTELRETYSNGTLRNWLYPAADNSLRATLAVNKVPSSGKVVIGQIHAYKSSMPLLKLEYQYKDYSASGNIVAKVRLSPEATIQVVTLASGISLNQRFTYVLHLTPKGTLAINLNGVKWSTRLDSAWASKPLYFKAGVYVQDNTGYTSEGGQVTFSKLDIDHDK